MGKNNFIATAKHTAKRKHGFTLVELTIVILVIGILAGITIVGYGAWRKSVATSQVKSELNSVAGAMESARNFGSGYPLAVPTTYKPSSGVTLTYISGDAKTYCIQATTTQDSSVIYRYDLTEKKEPQSGGCYVPGPIVSNLMHNPNPTSATYWKPSNTSVSSATYVTTGGYSAVRTTRLTTAAAALYGERNGTGVVTASTGDQHTVIFSLVSPVAASVTFQIGYGDAVSTTTLSGASMAITLAPNVARTFTYPFTVPAGIAAQPLYFKILWGTGVGAVGDYFDTYRVMWVAGNYTGAYGDGDNTAKGWSWASTQNLSTSTGPTL